MTFIDKQAHSVWVNGQEVEVEVTIEFLLSNPLYYSIFKFCNKIYLIYFYIFLSICFVFENYTI